MPDQIPGEEKKLIVIGGPTAVGKTSLAVDLARLWRTEIISADSRQIYKELCIGTAKPAEKLLREIRHHFIDEISIDSTFSAADFEQQALERLETLFRKHDTVVCAGGTGLYLRGLLEGFDEIPAVDEKVAKRVAEDFGVHGLEALADELRLKDPAYAKAADMENPHRVIRALSVIRQTKLPFSSFLTGESKPRNFTAIKICLTDDRAALYNRINERVDQMIFNGLEKEVLELVPFKDHQALNTVGYKELFDFFSGHIGRQAAIDLIKRNSRRYAKRQMTWFRNQGDWHCVEASSPNKIEQIIRISGL